VNAQTSIVVDRYELGPIATNCYVVRASRSADEAVVIDPSGDAAQLRLELARLGARAAAILITHGHWDHLLGVADLAEGTEAPVYMAEDEQALLENLPDLVPAGVPSRPYKADVLLKGDETLELAGITFETLPEVKLAVSFGSGGKLARMRRASLMSPVALRQLKISRRIPITELGFNARERSRDWVASLHIRKPE